MSRGQRVAKLGSPPSVTMATDISLAGKRRALSQRGERLISPLSAIVYLAHHSGPNMATAAARALEKSINPARFCMSVCVSVADGGLPQTIRWKNGARFPNISSLIKAGGSRSLQAKQTNAERKTGSVMFVASADGAPGGGGGGLCAAVLHPGANWFAPCFLQTFYRRLEEGGQPPRENTSSSVRMVRFDVCPPLPSSALKVLKRQGVHGAR